MTTSITCWELRLCIRVKDRCVSKRAEMNERRDRVASAIARVTASKSAGEVLAEIGIDDIIANAAITRCSRTPAGCCCT